MKRLLLSAVFLGLAASYACADIYQWTDSSGVIHMTDSMEKVPQGQRGKVRVIKEEPREWVAPAPEADGAGAPEYTGEELYGDETLEWWRQSFMKKRSEISDLETSIATKKEYVDVYESGRRFGQIYDSESSERYRRIKEELTGDQERLSGLKDEYEDFQRRATRAGVPRDIRQ